MSFFGVPCSATYIFFLFFEPRLGAGIYPGMAFTPFPSSILVETRLKLTIEEQILMRAANFRKINSVGNISALTANLSKLIGKTG